MEVTGKRILYNIVFRICMLGASCGYMVWEGETIVLPCGVDKPHKESAGSWCKMNNEIACVPVSYTELSSTDIFPPWTSADVQVVDGNSLNITSASFPRDNGTFRCTWLGIHESVELSVHVRVRNVTISGPRFPVPENTEVTFTCEAVGGNPAPNITWEIPETSLQPEPTVSNASSQISLTLIKDMNNQELICRAHQGERSLTGTMKLLITYKPTVEIRVTPAEYSLGDDVTLTCSADGFPRPVITWVFDGNFTGFTDVKNRVDIRTEVNANDNASNNSVQLGESFVANRHFRIASLSQHSTGTYTCVAVNSAGQDTAHINLTLGKTKGASLREMLLWTALGVLLLVVIIVLISTTLYIRSKRNNQAKGDEEAVSFELRTIPEITDVITSDDEQTFPKITLPEKFSPVAFVPDAAMSGKPRTETDIQDVTIPKTSMAQGSMSLAAIPESALPERAMPGISISDVTNSARSQSARSQIACADTEEHVYDEPDDVLPESTKTGSKDGRTALVPRDGGKREVIPDTRRFTKATPGKTVPRPAVPKKPKPNKTGSENITSKTAMVEMCGARVKEREICSKEKATSSMTGNLFSHTAVPREAKSGNAMPGTVVPKMQTPGKTIPVKTFPKKTASEKGMERSVGYKNDTPEKVTSENSMHNKASPDLVVSEQTPVKTTVVNDTTLDNTVPKTVMSENEEAEWMPRASVKDHEYEDLDDLPDEDPQICSKEKATSSMTRNVLSQTALSRETKSVKVMPGTVVPKVQTPGKNILVKTCQNKAKPEKDMERRVPYKNDTLEKVTSGNFMHKKASLKTDSPDLAVSEQTRVKTTFVNDTTLDNTVPKTVMSEKEEAEWMPRASVKDHEYEDLNDLPDEDPPLPCKKSALTVVTESPGTKASVPTEAIQAGTSRSLATSCGNAPQPSVVLRGTSTYMCAPATDKPSRVEMTRPPRSPAPPVSGPGSHVSSPLPASGPSGRTGWSATEDLGHVDLSNPPSSLAPSVDVAMQPFPPGSIATVDLIQASATAIATQVLKMLDDRVQALAGGQVSGRPPGREFPVTSATMDEDEGDSKDEGQFYQNT